MKSKLAFPIIIVLAIFLAYLNSLSNGFVWLDQAEILNKNLIISDFKAFVQILLFDDNNYQGYHRPMYNLMHTLDYKIWNNNAFGFHLSSLIIHIANVLLIYFTAINFNSRRWTALAIALIFGLLPCHTATVSLIHSKADLLACFFILMPIFLFSKTDYKNNNSPNIARLILWCALLVLSLWSKELAIMLPFYIVALGYLLHKQNFSIPKSLYLYPALICMVFIVYRFGISDTADHSVTSTLFDRLLSFIPVYVHYITHTLSSYELTTNDAVMIWNYISAGDYALYVLGFILILAAQYYFSRKSVVIAAGFLWFNIFMIPVSQIIPILHFRADRFLYIPSIGFIIAMVHILLYYYRDFDWKNKRGAVILLFGILMFIYSFKIWDRNKDFASNELMFGELIRTHPECREAQGIVGNEYFKKGKYDKALVHLEEALVKQNNYFSYVDEKANQGNVGVIYMQQNRIKEALGIFTKLKALESYNPVVLFNIGICQKKLKNYNEAKTNLEEYLKYKPNNIDALFNLGQIGIELGDKRMTKDYFRKYLKYNPSSQFRETIENFLNE